MAGGLRGFVLGFLFGLGSGFFQRVLTLKCAVIAAFTAKVNIYFLLFLQALGYPIFTTEDTEITKVPACARGYGAARVEGRIGSGD